MSTASATSVVSHQQHGRPIDPRTLRRACGMFVTGVTVITSGTRERAEGTTVNSFTSVSLEPPLVLFCLHRRSRLRTSVETTRSFAVNFLSGRQEELAHAFSTPRPDTFGGVPHHFGEDGLPFLSEALVHLACTTVDVYAGGDHDIIVGEVVSMAIREQPGEPLVFFGGALGSMAGCPTGSFTHGAPQATAAAPKGPDT